MGLFLLLLLLFRGRGGGTTAAEYKISLHVHFARSECQRFRRLN